MNIKELFSNSFGLGNISKLDFSLVKYCDGVYVGVDSQGYCSIVVESTTPNQNQIMQKTKLLSLECNVQVSYSVDGVINSSIVHVLRCYSTEKEEIELFLELTSLFILEDDFSEQHLLHVFVTMADFFSKKSEPSDIELQGLYAELFTIKKFKPFFHIEKSWQSKDRMKFDFSISDKLKIEVKSTLKNDRVHHFKHDQLTSNIYDIYIVSFMLRHDDCGLSLYDLLLEMKAVYSDDPERLLKICKIIKNTSEWRLHDMKFEENYTNSQIKVFVAQDVPKFKQSTPDGLFNAEYDCSLENIKCMDINSFIKNISEEIKSI